MRKGTIGGFKAEFDSDLNAKFDEFIEDSKLMQSGFQFEFSADR
jgi:hypothetical protein